MFTVSFYKEKRRIVTNAKQMSHNIETSNNQQSEMPNSSNNALHNQTYLTLK
jgi:hypothetical protein